MNTFGAVYQIPFLSEVEYCFSILHPSRGLLIQRTRALRPRQDIKLGVDTGLSFSRRRYVGFSVSAAPALIGSLYSVSSEKKVRIAGRLLSYESETQPIVLQKESNEACLVDVTLLLDDLVGLATVHESKSIAMVIGYIESTLDKLPVPMMPAFMDAPNIGPSLVMPAIFLTPVAMPNLALWREAIRRREEATGHNQ